MTRTIISISENTKHWLDQYSRQRNISLAQTIRLAIQQFQESQGNKMYHQNLNETFGLWKKQGKIIDSVKFVRKLREEWDR